MFPVVPAFFDQPVMYRRMYVQFGGVTCAVFLSYLVKRDLNNKSGEPIYSSISDIEKETGLTRGEQLKARRILKNIGITSEENIGTPSRRYIHVDLTVVNDLLIENGAFL